MPLDYENSKSRKASVLSNVHYPHACDCEGHIHSPTPRLQRRCCRCGLALAHANLFHSIPRGVQKSTVSISETALFLIGRIPHWQSSPAEDRTIAGSISSKKARDCIIFDTACIMHGQKVHLKSEVDFLESLGAS